MQRKPDDEAIGAFFAELSKEPWLGRKRHNWPHDCFHITDVRNAASILRHGQLLSRVRAEALHYMQTDNASPAVLSGTDPWFFHFARLYFRPRTPTFWNNEGMRPPTSQSMDSHCPVPIALVFDLPTVAGIAGVKFSDGNLASPISKTGEDVGFLRNLNFQDIYHDQPLGALERNRIVRARQSEIIVPESLPLDGLRFVVARSDAERQTLLTTLSDQGGHMPLPLQDVVTHPGTFHGRWTYVERVSLSGGIIRVEFSPDSLTPGPFAAKWILCSVSNGVILSDTVTIKGAGLYRLPVPASMQGQPLRFDLWLDDSLAFAGELRDMPSMSHLTWGS